MQLKKKNKISQQDIEKNLKKKRMQLKFKRIFDFFISLLGFIFLSPLLLIISIMIKLNSKGPIFFKQTRVGKDEVNFKILKFRTMVTNSEKLGMQITVGKDPRITKIGYYLRKYKLDELPQLINVLKGEMSFVGPRPEVPKYVELYTNYQKNILKIKPGITDLASIEYRDESNLLSKSKNPEDTYINEIMQKKIELNMEYLQNISLLYDVKLILKTIMVIIK